MDTPNTFWTQMEHYGTRIAGLSAGQGLRLDEICEVCGGVCALLRSPEALHAMADPRNVSQASRYRQALADHWSVLNGHLEEELARTVWEKAPTHADFLRLINAHPLFHNGDQVAGAEIALLEEQGLGMDGLRVAVIGPGAVPYTALQYASKGASVLGVDYSAEVNLWLKHWFHRYFPRLPLGTFQGYAHMADYRACDVVLVAAMLVEKPAILAKLAADKPRYVLLRSTSARRPLGVLQPQLDAATLNMLEGYRYVGETSPPAHIGNFTLLYARPH